MRKLATSQTRNVLLPSRLAIWRPSGTVDQIEDVGRQSPYFLNLAQVFRRPASYRIPLAVSDDMFAVGAVCQGVDGCGFPLERAQVGAVPGIPHFQFTLFVTRCAVAPEDLCAILLFCPHVIVFVFELLQGFAFSRVTGDIFQREGPGFFSWLWQVGLEIIGRR